MIKKPDFLKLRVLLCFLKLPAEDRTVTGIARTLNVEKYKISRVIIALENEGYIDREQVENSNNISMANDGFEHPCKLCVKNGDGTEFLVANTEDMKTKEPDIILRAAHGMPDQVREMFAEEFKTNDIWKHFSAVQNGKVYDPDSSLFNMTANFQYADALKSLQPMLYGEE